MNHYLVLSIATIIIVFLAIKIWRKTRNVGFIIGLGLIYYWTLLGAWFIVYDYFSGYAGSSFGLHYYYLFDKMFPVKADNIYLYSNILYSVFIITIELIIFFFAKKPKPKSENATLYSFTIKIRWILIVAAVFLLCSFMIVRKEIICALANNESVYSYLAVNRNGLYSIHQLLNTFSMIIITIGIVSLLSEKIARQILVRKKSALRYIFVFLLFIIAETYLSFLGNKKEILSIGIIGFILILHNTSGKINWYKMGVFIFLIVTPLVFNDAFRKFSTMVVNKWEAEIKENFSLEKNPEMTTEDIHHNYNLPEMKGVLSETLSNIVFSNEMFCAHFSMYGVIKHKVPFTWGSSFKSLALSFIPKAIYPNRPEGIYAYYAKQLKVEQNQGYTINHSTAWYLNFGIPGLIIGAVLLGLFWVFLYNFSFQIERLKFQILKILFVLGPALLVSQIPVIIRNGPEAYKSVLFESLIIPTILIFICSDKFHLKKLFKSLRRDKSSVIISSE